MIIQEELCSDIKQVSRIPLNRKGKQPTKYQKFVVSHRAILNLIKVLDSIFMPKCNRLSTFS